MAAQNDLQLVREIFAAWNAHDLHAYIKRLDASASVESDAFPAPFRGHEGARQFFQVYLTAFPDLRLDVEQLLGAGGFVTARWRATGTHRGPLMGIAPSGQKVELHGCTVFEVKDARAARSWVYFDNARLMRQIGALAA